jgi:TonB family protein
MRPLSRAVSYPTLLCLLAFGREASAQAEGEGAVPRDGAGAIVRQAPEAEPPKKLEVVPPSLTQFENAPYPPAAEKAGLEGDVVLKLTIDAQGNVTASEVNQPAGNGFDEAARQASLKFKFRPATRGGKPVAAQILYRYSFTLKPATPTVAEQPPPAAGELGGTLKIRGNDEPLAGVEIAVTLPDGSERRVSTDGEGRFRLDNLSPGRIRVRVAAPGFREFTSEEDVVAGEAADLVYRISPESTGFEIVIEGERPPREVTRRTIDRREVDRIPGTSGDALRSLESLPGVARPPPFSGLLIVRGSAPEDTNFFFDGSLVPLGYHFGGLTSVIPTELLDRIDFYPGNFSARYGRVQGGIVDVGLRTPDTRCFADYGKATNEKGCYHGLVQADLIDGRAMLQGPVFGSRDWSFAIAGRRSWLDVWLKPVLEESGASVTSAPVYYDYQAIVERKRGNSRFSLRAYGSDDRLEIIVTDPAAEDPGFGGGVTLGIAFWRLQALYEDKLSRAVNLSSMLSVGRDKFAFKLGTFQFDLDAWPIYSRQEFGFSLAEGIKLNTGLDFWVAPAEVGVRAPEPPQPGEPDPGPFVTRPVLETRDKTTSFRPGWYAEFELQPLPRLRVVPGARFDYARDSGQSDFSPRVNARFDVFPPASAEDQVAGITRRRTTLKGGVGLFTQPPEFQETDRVFGTPNLKSNRAVHYTLGVEQEISKQVDVGVEGYYKDLTRQVSRAPSGAGFNYRNDGTGYAMGLETLIKYKADPRFFGWIAYTLSRSVRQQGPDEPERLFEYDQTHNLIVLGSYRLGRGWEFGGRFNLASGRLVTPAVSPPALTSLYVADAGSWVPLEGEAFSRRLPLAHQLDLRIDKRWQFKDWRFSAYLDVKNVYNNAVPEDLVYNYNASEEQYQTGVPIIPSFGVRGEF